MSVLDTLNARARSAQKTVVLPEGQDPRVVTAANKAMDLGIAAKIIVLGSEAEIAAAENGNEQADLAVKMFVRRIVKYIGAYYTLIGNCDCISFTGGIGEFSVQIRKKVMEQLSALGLKLNEESNNACFGKAGIISTDDSKVLICVIPTNEEIAIAKDTLELVSK